MSMETAGGAIIRVACGFTAPTAEPYHYWHLLGTLGEVETGRRATSAGAPAGGLIWQANRHTRGRSEVEWSFTPHQPALPQAGASGHEGLDLYPAQALVESVLDGRPVPVDVYRAAEIDGAAIVAAESAERRGVPLPVPDFRPGPHRSAGLAPAAPRRDAAPR